MAPVIWLDDDDLSAWGFQSKSTAGLDGANPAVRPTLTLPGLGHDLVSSAVGAAPPRRFTVTLVWRGSSLSALETAMHVLRERCDGTELRFRHALRSNQQLRARCTALPVAYAPGAKYLAPYHWEPTLEFEAADPDWEDVDAAMQTVTVAANTPLPQGTAPTRPVLRITASGGSVVNPQWVYKNSAGTTLVTVSPTVTLANGDAWELDVQAQLVQQRVSGVWQDARATLPVNALFPIFSPKDGVYASATWPTGTVIGTNATGLATYRRRWK